MEKSFMNNNTPVQISRNLLETLISLAGELVLGRNQLIQGINDADMAAIETSGQHIDLITSEIQDAIMQTRMQSVAGLLGKICQKFGDRVILDKTGKDVTLDRSILESVSEPLDALVEFLIKAGQDTFTSSGEIEKSNKDKILLKAFQDAGQVSIGISTGRALLSLADIPETITTAIDAIEGVIEVESQETKGSTVTFKLPLTQAIIPSQIISIGKEKFAVPQANLSELIRVPATDTKNIIKKVGDADVIRLRGELLPLLDLSGLLGIEQSSAGPEGKNAASVTNLAIVFSENFKFGIVVDQFYDAEEIVVKPFGRHFKKNKAYAGATIMGDGSVSLIFDIMSLAQMAGLSTVSQSQQQLSKETNQETVYDGDKESIVMFKNLETEHFAASFKYVQRIERFKTADIERIKDRNIIQYRGKALRLYDISEIADVQPQPKKELQEVIVFKVNEKEFGLMVSPPVDILDVHLDVDEASFKQLGIKGTMSINGHTTLVLDIPETAEAFWMEVCNYV